ncbi:MAG: hypothetical protein ABUS54_09665 [Actinomycetota bacterium]
MCAVPLLGEAMRAAIDFADVRVFSERGGDVSGLLEWLRPDAIVVDSDAAARVSADYALDHGVPLVHVSPRERALRLLRGGSWRDVDGADLSSDGVRALLAGVLFARETRV